VQGFPSRAFLNQRLAHSNHTGVLASISSHEYIVAPAINEIIKSTLVGEAGFPTLVQIKTKVKE